MFFVRSLPMKVMIEQREPRHIRPVKETLGISYKLLNFEVTTYLQVPINAIYKHQLQSFT